MHLKSLRKLLGAALVASALGLGASGASKQAKPNVLFIAADDLRADLGCYGAEYAKTPNIDALARRGVVFTRAYCQQSVCNPSRASLLTGLRPDTIKVWDLRTHFRDAMPNVVTLPQHFKNSGYTTINLGKIFHNQGSGRKMPVPFNDYPFSWSVEPQFSAGVHWRDWVVPGRPEGPERKAEAVQCLDVPDNAYLDGRIADAACKTLVDLKEKGDPFFLAVGFWKPHLPFNAPKKYWDLYDRANLGMSVAPPAKGAPEIASHNSDELRNYRGIPQEGPLDAEQAAELRHGYLAGISFLDAQVGRVVAQLDRLGLAENTVIVFWSDHGFELGDHGMWGKSTNYELDNLSPLIVAAPNAGRKGAKADGIVELLDIYPTLVDLCGLAEVKELEGQTLRPLLENPSAKGRVAAVSQHTRPHFDGPNTHMGYTLRTDRYRYVEWREIDGGKVVGREFYDHRADPRETVNRADDPSHAREVRRHAEMLADLLQKSSPRRGA